MKKSFLFLVFTVNFIFYLNCTGKKMHEQSMESDTIRLPQPRLKSDVSIEEALSRRRSSRDYKDESITITDISQLLWAAYGITKPDNSGRDFLRGGYRTAPSAGGLYPLEFYVVAGKVEGLKPGVYKYISEKHELKKVLDGDIRKELSSSSMRQEMLGIAPATIVVTAVFARTTVKYGARGRERYVLMDAGHSVENFCLQSVSLNLGTCTVGAFLDDKVSEALKLPKDEEPLYLLPVGKKK